MSANRSPEPQYQGRPLHEWLALLDKRPPVSAGASQASWNRRSADMAAARQAISQIGTNALPEYQRMLRRRDWPGRAGVVSWVARHPALGGVLKFGPSAETDQTRALTALTCLGHAARPTLPAIVALFPDASSWVRLHALFALNAMAPDASSVAPILPALTNALSDPEYTMRLAAMNALCNIRPPAIDGPSLLRLLDDSDAPVRETAMQHLVAQTNALALPVLLRQLNGSDAREAGDAAANLAVFGHSATAALPRLQQLCNDPLLTVRMAATNAIVAISGEKPQAAPLNEPADITFRFPSIPVSQFVEIFYAPLAGRKIAPPAGGWPNTQLSVDTPAPLTKTQALQLIEELLRQQAHVTIRHERDGALTAVEDQSGPNQQR